mmetsp:Transcript_32967/g.52806  ORF Transcript_32967/g.52806 Transcript_32967/m.52806 type:complete len:380 (+) Transcript_32967:4688-5827(+)
MKVCVVGNGYVGLPLAVLTKQSGHQVVGFDADPRKVEMLQSGISPIDDVMDSELEGLTFTNKPELIQDCDVDIICVPTPVNDNKTPNLRIINAVKQTLSEHAKGGSLIILESTVGVGDTRKVFGDFVERGFNVANSPERIDPSRKKPTLHEIPKVVGGLNGESTKVAAAFYQSVFAEVVPVASAEHSEATKLLENSFRAVNISFINEFADFCKMSGLDTDHIIDAASTKPYGFTPFRSWIGVGGHCIPVDPHYLIESTPGMKWPILESSMTAMHARPARLAAERTDPSTQKVLVCGVSYKPNVSDVRDAPQAAFIKELIENKVQVEYYDPLVENYMGLEKVTDLSRVEDYDKVFIMHQHDCCPELGAIRSLDNVEAFCR